MSKRRGKSGKAKFFGPVSPRSSFQLVNRVPKETICVAVTTMGHMMTDAIHSLLRELDLKSLTPNYPYSFLQHRVNNHKPVPFARNALVKRFLEVKRAKKLWFIDSDILPSGREVELLDIDADIVAGTYPIYRASGKHSAGPTPKVFHAQVVPSVYDYSFEKAKWKHTEVTQGEIIEKSGAGTGMMIIKRHVLEDPRMRLPDEWEDLDGEVRKLDPHEAPPVFRDVYRANGALETTDDLDFCRRAMKCGFTLKAHTGIVSDHIKPVKLMDIVYLSDQARAEGRRQAEYEVQRGTA